MYMIAIQHCHSRVLLLAQVMEGVITRTLRVTTTVVILKTMAVHRDMEATAVRAPSFPLSDIHSSLEQLQVAVIRGTKWAVTTRVLGLEAVATVVQDVRSMGVLTQ